MKLNDPQKLRAFEDEHRPPDYDAMPLDDLCSFRLSARVVPQVAFVTNPVGDTTVREVTGRNRRKGT